MPEIHVLDENTIDKIAAGEVVERPRSVVKELVENAIDAGAEAVTVEIKGGGIDFIRVTDNGCGMEKEQVATAFLRHATSKIRTIEDLEGIRSLGFRGEALSSIAAVSQVELITKTAQEITGVRYVIEGAQEKSMEEIGAPSGTTFLIRNLFFNTPVRRKFLKTATTEGNYITDLLEHLALANPDISFKYIKDNKTLISTSGNGNRKEVIYHIFGRDINSHLIPFEEEDGGMRVSGFLAEPLVARSNRNFEIYFVNGRFIKSNIISKALEEAYKPVLMQRKYPFAIFDFFLNEGLDVNVHPSKMEVRFSDNEQVFDFLKNAVKEALNNRERIPEARLLEPKRPDKSMMAQPDRKSVMPLPDTAALSNRSRLLTQPVKNYRAPEPFEYNRKKKESTPEKQLAVLDEVLLKEPPIPYGNPTLKPESAASVPITAPSAIPAQTEQMNLFEEKILTKKASDEYEIVGQVFDTYWIVGYRDRLLFIDQHAAHEKVIYERLKKKISQKEVLSQQLNPPLVISVTAKEEEVLTTYRENFAETGFEIEPFGGNEYAVRAVPSDLYELNAKDIFLEMIDDLMDGLLKERDTDTVNDRIATMSCKAAVKGNMHLSGTEAKALIDELLELENPYNCPHGRPTIIAMTKYEMEKKFKRIV